MMLTRWRHSWPERAVALPILVLLAVLTVIAWAITIWQAGSSAALMDAGVPMALGTSGRLAVDSALLFLAVWLAMMAAMMFPSVWPVVLAYAATHERRRSAIALFIVGYLLVWEAFGVLAYLLYVGVGALVAASPMLANSLSIVTGALIVVAGLYQFTPVKNQCLLRCQGATGIFRSSRQSDRIGALPSGIRHGFDCLGCCSGLMVVLLALGAMDLRWMATVAILIALEKLGPRTRILPAVVGVGLIAVGVIVVLTPTSGMQSM